jgi:hypothetical protein
MTDRRMQEVQDEVRRVAHAVRAQEAEDQGDGWFRCIPHAGRLPSSTSVSIAGSAAAVRRGRSRDRRRQQVPCDAGRRARAVVSRRRAGLEPYLLQGVQFRAVPDCHPPIVLGVARPLKTKVRWRGTPQATSLNADIS